MVDPTPDAAHDPLAANAPASGTEDDSAVQEPMPAGGRKVRINKLNDLDSTQWLKFQKSWFIHNPPPRRANVLLHPAKYPETLVQQFIEFFTKRGMTVLDPMLGTGTTLISCIRSGRNGYGIELNPRYAAIAQAEVARELTQQPLFGTHPRVTVINDDARNLPKLNLPPIDYCITSPPYWDMLRMKGADTQRDRREKGLDVAYSEDHRDLGNIEDYETFLAELVGIYGQVYQVLRDRAYLTIIVKNVKKKGRMYPLAWDLGRELGRLYVLKDEKIWCQDSQGLNPFGLGSAWVSNTFHHYCLNFRKEL